MTVTPAGCNATGTKPKSGKIRVSLQTPLCGNFASFVVDLGTFMGS